MKPYQKNILLYLCTAAALLLMGAGVQETPFQYGRNAGQLGPISHYNAIVFDYFESYGANAEGAVAVGGASRIGTGGQYDFGASAEAGYAYVSVGAYENPNGYPTLLLNGLPDVGREGYSNVHAYGGPVAMGDNLKEAYEKLPRKILGTTRYVAKEAVEGFFVHGEATVREAVMKLSAANKAPESFIDITQFAGYWIPNPPFQGLELAGSFFEPDNGDFSGQSAIVINIDSGESANITSPSLTAPQSGKQFADYDIIVLNFPNARDISFFGGSLIADGQELNTTATGYWNPQENALLNTYCQRVVWNFPQAKRIDIQGHGVVGAILAPDALITGGGGSINGMVAAKSFVASGGMQLHSFPVNEAIFNIGQENEVYYDAAFLMTDQADEKVTLDSGAFTLEKWGNGGWVSHSDKVYFPDSYGRFAVKQLAKGAYRLVQVQHPYGYRPPAESGGYFYFEMPADTYIPLAYAKMAETVNFFLEDAESGHGVAGAEFSLYKTSYASRSLFHVAGESQESLGENWMPSLTGNGLPEDDGLMTGAGGLPISLVETAISDGTGRFVMENIGVGGYMLVETKAAPGYENNPLHLFLSAEDKGATTLELQYGWEIADTPLGFGETITIVSEPHETADSFPIVILSKTDVAGNRLAGAVFSLEKKEAGGQWSDFYINDGGNVVSQFVTSGFGDFIIDFSNTMETDIEGIYRLVEVEAPEGFEILDGNNIQYFYISEDNSIEGLPAEALRAYDDGYFQNRGVRVEETTLAQGGPEAEPAEWAPQDTLFYSRDMELLQTPAEDPPPWETPAAFYPLLNSHENSLYIEVQNQPIIYNIQIVTVEKNTETPLEGATFELYRIIGRNTVFVGKYTTENGTVLIGDNGEALTAGKYALAETETPMGYEPWENSLVFSLPYDGLAGDWEDAILEMDGSRRLLTVNGAHTKSTGSVHVVKKGVHPADLSVTLLEGVQFQLYIYNIMERDFERYDNLTYATGPDGVVIIDNLPLGNYMLIETENPNPGYQPPENSQGKFYFSIRANGVVQHLEIANFRKLPEMAALLWKLDAETKKALPGAIFEVSVPNPRALPGNGGRMDWIPDRSGLVTDNDGALIIDDLTPGVYKIKEIKSPDGYLPHKRDEPFEAIFEVLQKDAGDDLIIDNITEISTSGVTLVNDNEVKVKNVEHHQFPHMALYKIDGDTGKGLEGAGFALYMKNDLTGEYYLEAALSSNETGRILFPELEAGLYRLEEVQAPMGYELTDGVFEFEIRDTGETEINGSPVLKAYYQGYEITQETAKDLIIYNTIGVEKPEETPPPEEGGGTKPSGPGGDGEANNNNEGTLQPEPDEISPGGNESFSENPERELPAAEEVLDTVYDNLGNQYYARAVGESAAGVYEIYDASMNFMGYARIPLGGTFVDILDDITDTPKAAIKANPATGDRRDMGTTRHLFLGMLVAMGLLVFLQGKLNDIP